MNLRAQLKSIEAKANALKAKIAEEARVAKQREKKLRKLPSLVGLGSVRELIRALKKLDGGTVKARRKVGKRVRLDPAVKARMIAEAMKEGANRKAIAKKYGSNLNSLNVWVGRAKKQK